MNGLKLDDTCAVGKVFSSKISDFMGNKQKDIRDYLIHDLKILPSKNEIEIFLDGVDEVKSRTEKLMKKIK